MLRRSGPGGRLFAVFAVLSFLPVLALGALLAVENRNQAQDRGIEQGVAQAEVVGRVLVETQLGGRNLNAGLTLAEFRQVSIFTATEIASGGVVRLRLRAPDQHVVFSSDGSTPDAEDDEAREALGGEPVAQITHLNDDDRSGPAGVRVVEVYTALRAPHTRAVIGVLEIYLPYEPIAADLAAGLNRLYGALAGGLTLLYLMLATLAGWTTRRLARQSARYEHLATHDALTDLPNRGTFELRLGQALAAGETVAVVTVDLDRFREVNDTLGYHNGDVLLIDIADRLRAAARPGDTVARLGADEYGVILLGVSDLGGVRRIIDAVEAEVELGGLPLHPQAAAGVAFAPRDGAEPGVLMQRADMARTVAKNTHHAAVAYAPGQDHYNEERLALVGELRRAVERGELVLHYQPQVNSSNGEVDTFEALVRWQHPVRGLLPPDTFVPMAEQTGLIDDLTVWVLDAALAQLKSWRCDQPALSVAVNISARTLQQPHFPQLVSAALERAGAAPDWLVLEITETALITDPEGAATVLGQLSEAGLTLSLDDFGQGYTSLSQLPQLPLSELKIDKSFVMNMSGSPRDAVIVRSVVDLAHNLGLRVVAEGVEHEQSLAMLQDLGCDILQGYFFSRPLPAEKVPAWLAAQGAGAGAPAGPISARLNRRRPRRSCRARSSR